MKTLVLLFGPPAVGKMTVGRALEALTGLPLLHNHMTIELVLPFFEFGSPPFSRLVGEFRNRIIEEVVDSDSPGMLFTVVWAFGESGDTESVEGLRERFAKRDGRTVFVELWAPLDVRLERNGTTQRLAEKPSKRDVAASRARLLNTEKKYVMNSDGDFPFENHIRVDTTKLTPAEAAIRIADAFDLPRLDSSPRGPATDPTEDRIHD